MQEKTITIIWLLTLTSMLIAVASDELEVRNKANSNLGYILPEGYSEDTDGIWQCIEFRNETVVNPEYLDKCCADISMDSDSSVDFGGVICINGAGIESITIENQNINLTNCANTTRELQTNETYCAIKERIF